MVNYKNKLSKLKDKEIEIKNKKIELQMQVLRMLKFKKNLKNKQICLYLDITCPNFNKYYTGKRLLKDETLVKLMEMMEDDK